MQAKVVLHIVSVHTVLYYTGECGAKQFGRTISLKYVSKVFKVCYKVTMQANIVPHNVPVHSNG